MIRRCAAPTRTAWLKDTRASAVKSSFDVARSEVGPGIAFRLRYRTSSYWGAKPGWTLTGAPLPWAVTMLTAAFQVSERALTHAATSARPAVPWLVPAYGV